MGRKMEDGSWKDACLDKVKPGEPIFVLRGQDLLAPIMVEDWATAAQARGCPQEKVDEARACAASMRAWAHEHGGKYPD